MKILDATCGNRMMWFDKNDPETTFIDIRQETKPDIVMSCTKTKFKDREFDVIIFDPPHVNVGKNSDMSKRYGHFTSREIKLLVKDGFKEFNRILKTKGMVMFKWNNHSIKLETVLSLIEDFRPLFGQQVSIRRKHVSMTYWICLKKKITRRRSPRRIWKLR